MPHIVRLPVEHEQILATLQVFFSRILQQTQVDAMLAPVHLPMKHVVMPSLVADPGKMTGADPLSPSFPMNSAKLVSRLTRRSGRGRFAVVLRPCEIRAFVELVKLKQGRMDKVFIIGLDCLGAFSNTAYSKFAGECGRDATTRFCNHVLFGGRDALDGFDLASACRCCEHFVPHGADLHIQLYGGNVRKEILIRCESDQGSAMADALKLEEAADPQDRAMVVNDLLNVRKAARDRMYANTATVVDSIEKLTRYLADCVNCFNCRVACPVCYCRECVFMTDVFDHDPDRYLGWAERKGMVKMPTDTVFYHLTRMAHMSTACVGCGQCTNACPNDIPVVELFRLVAHRTQVAFDYPAGKDVGDRPPLAEFRESEYTEVVGL